MASTYENIPVFRAPDYNDVENIIGRASVEIDDKEEAAIITIEAKGPFLEFLLMGELKALTLSGFVSNVDSEKAKEFWSKQRR